jgi:hypothetical protein
VEQSPSWKANNHSVSQEVPRLLWNQMFITVFTTARHWPLSWARCIQFTTSHPISLHSILILSSSLRLGLPSGLLPSGFYIKNNVFVSNISRACYMFHPSHPPKFDHPNNIWWIVQVMKLLIMRPSSAFKKTVRKNPNKWVAQLHDLSISSQIPPLSSSKHISPREIVV